METVTLVEVLPTRIWVESDMMGARHVVVHHQDFSEPFTYATFHYDYAYTSNSGTHDAAENLARALGATDPIAHKPRDPERLTVEGLRGHIAELTEMLAWMEDEQT